MVNLIHLDLIHDKFFKSLFYAKPKVHFAFSVKKDYVK